MLVQPVRYIQLPLSSLPPDQVPNTLLRAINYKVLLTLPTSSSRKQETQSTGQAGWTHPIEYKSHP